MDFRVTEDQAALREGIRSFCEGRIPFDTIVESAERPLDPALWTELAELGVFSLREPEAEGGLGFGLAEAVLVLAELARHLVPGPVLWSALTASLVPEVAEGKSIVTGLDRTRETSGPILVEHFEASDTLIVLESESIRRIERSDLAGRPIETPLDPLTPLHQLSTLPPGKSIGDGGASRKLAREGTLLAAAMQLGLSEASLEHATRYALEREQFDRQIGSFQAIKHILADMLVRKEQAKAAVYAAAATADGRGVSDVERMISTAKLMAGEAAHKNARNCVQVYGGMGYVWEMPPHFLLKRSFVLENVFGTMDEHADRIAETLAS